MDYEGMSYKELQQLAKERGIPANKKKAELIELLVQQDDDQPEEKHEEVVEEPVADAAAPEHEDDELVAGLESLSISAAPAPAVAEQEEDLQALTVAELKAKATALGIVPPKKKADIIAAIVAAASATAEANTESKGAENDDAVEDEQLLRFIERCDFLDFNEHGRVVCTLTGHEMKPRFSIVMEHVTGESVTNKLKARKAAEEANVIKLAGIPSPKGKKKIFNTPDKSRALDEMNVRWTYEDYEREI